MRTDRTPHAFRHNAFGYQRGSAIIFALLACLTACIAVQMLAAAVVCGHRAIADEKIGRDSLAARDECLVQLLDKAEEEWGPTDPSNFEAGGANLSARLALGETSGEWALVVQVQEQSNTSVATNALVERGRDGLDLPTAALVADRVVVGSERISPWLSVTGGTASACVSVVQGSAPIGEGCEERPLDSTWVLGDGWREVMAEAGAREDDCMVVAGEPGQVVRASEDVREASRDHPVLLVVLGGADLDLRDMGELWAIVVVDEGSLAMEGTAVRGAVFVTKDVELGYDGQVVYEEKVLQWARDRSLTRTRLVPGSRREVTE